MIKHAYHYLFYRTYEVIHKTNINNGENSSTSYLSTIFFINVLSLYAVFFESFNKTFYYVFIAIGVSIVFLNFRYFDERKRKYIILEFKNTQIKTAYKYLVDAYPVMSFFIFLISLGAGYNTIFYFLGILILIKLVTYFWNM